MVTVSEATSLAGMNGGRALVAALKAEGVETVFGIPGASASESHKNIRSR